MHVRWTNTPRESASRPPMRKDFGERARRSWRWGVGRRHCSTCARRRPSTLDPSLRRQCLRRRWSRCDTILRPRRPWIRWIALAPTNLQAIQLKAMIRLGQGDLAGATAVIETPPPDVPVTRLVAYFATYSDLFYVLTSEQQTLLLRLPPSEFDDDRGSWGLALAETAALRGDQKLARPLRRLGADRVRRAVAHRARGRTAPRASGRGPRLSRPEGRGNPRG